MFILASYFDKQYHTLEINLNRQQLIDNIQKLGEICFLWREFSQKKTWNFKRSHVKLLFLNQKATLKKGREYWYSAYSHTQLKLYKRTKNYARKKQFVGLMSCYEDKKVYFTVKDWPDVPLLSIFLFSTLQFNRNSIENSVKWGKKIEDLGRRKSFWLHWMLYCC